jgi:hypothetical protein
MARVLKASVPVTMVAASDASFKACALATYRCDGTADDEEIQAAIDALPSGGGKVQLSEGTFNTAATVTVSPNQRLEGQGKATILKAQSGLNAAVIDSPSGQASRYIELVNFKIDGNRANNTSGRGVSLISPRNCLLKGLWIVETDEEAIKLAGVDGTLGWYNWITECEVDQCDEGINIAGFCEQNWITSNLITFVVGKGIFCEANLDKIAFNNLDQIAGFSILVEFGGGLHDILYNKIDNPGSEGIVLRGSHGSRVIGNYFSACPANKALIHNGTVDAANSPSDDLIVVHNISRATGESGSVGIEESVASDGCRYLDNTLTGPATAIVPHASSTNLKIRNNDGFVTENSGTATLVNGQTSIAVTHGLDVTPGVGDVMVTPIEAWGAAVNFWIDTYTSTQFTINVDANPGQDVDFAWKAVVL